MALKAASTTLDGASHLFNDVFRVVYVKGYVFFL